VFIPVFNSAVCVFDFEHHETYGGKKEIDSTLNTLFQLPEVVEKENVDDAQGGRALSTAHLYKSHVIPELLNFKKSPLGQWILWRIYESAQQLGFDKTRNIKKLKYHRTWANRMTQGCSAVAHRHAGKDWSIPHLVAIYYTDVPQDSADLVFINDDKPDVMRGEALDQYAKENQKKITSKAGRLICHDARLLHATTMHKSILSRTCLIIEVGFPPMKS
jgi:hypothetical protein